MPLEGRYERGINIRPSVMDSIHLHIFNGIDGNASHTNVTPHAGMIRVIAPMRREVEGDAKSLLPCHATTREKSRDAEPLYAKYTFSSSTQL